MIATLLLAAALAAPCPWPANDEPSMVDTTLGSVVIDGHPYAVRGKPARIVFESMLHDCNADAAIAPFKQWRAYRRGININGGLAVATGWLVVGWIPVGFLIIDAVAVPVPKRKMIAAIVAATP